MFRRFTHAAALVPLVLQAACDSGNKPKAAPVGPVTVSRAPTSAPREEEVAALKNFVGDSPKPAATPSSAPSAAPVAGRAARDGNRSLPNGEIPPPLQPTQALKYDVPSDWVTVPPASRFRKAQWSLPRVEPDAEDGVVVLSYFGKGQGGGIAGNMMRWKGMFSTEEGKPVPEEAIKQESFTSNSLKVTLVDITGRFAEAMMPGAPPTAVKSNHRMISAIVETSDGSYFFKCTAPAATLAKHEPGIRSLLKSVRQ